MRVHSSLTSSSGITGTCLLCNSSACVKHPYDCAHIPCLLSRQIVDCAGKKFQAEKPLTTHCSSSHIVVLFAARCGSP